MQAALMVETALAAARAAGAAIMPFYRRDLAIVAKADGSPLTLADSAAHGAIESRLRGTGLPVVSEEGDALHLDAETYWLVDPLDGTKDFLAANGEFTVNVAIVHRGEPLVGVVYAPALEEVYAGGRGVGAWHERNGVRQACVASPRRDRPRMAVSRFHDHQDTLVFARANEVTERVPLGSALKYGRLCAGEIDVYPRLEGTSEWDTAAGQAILEASGGGLFDWHTGEPLRYGKPRRRNGRFLALRAPYRPAEFHREAYAAGLL